MVYALLFRISSHRFSLIDERGENAGAVAAAVSDLRSSGDSFRKTRLGPRLHQADPSGDGYLAENVLFKLMMAVIYRVPIRQISGGPEWFNTATFNTDTKADGKQSVDELHRRIRRPRLKTHAASSNAASLLAPIKRVARRG